MYEDIAALPLANPCEEMLTEGVLEVLTVRYDDDDDAIDGDDDDNDVVDDELGDIAAAAAAA